MRRAAKWAGTSIGAMIVAAYVVSVWWGVACGVPLNITVGIGYGAAIVGWNYPEYSLDPEYGRLQSEYLDPPDWENFCWLPECVLDRSVGGVSVPLWIPFILAAVPTGLLWRADRRAARRGMAGHCADCGYDRASLGADAKCPECGTVSS
jgi:hypothetical protein